MMVCQDWDFSVLLEVKETPGLQDLLVNTVSLVLREIVSVEGKENLVFWADLEIQVRRTNQLKSNFLIIPLI